MSTAEGAALAPIDRAMLGGELGAAAATAMRLLQRFARAVGAERFIDISGAHIDGCLYHGRVSLDFVERFVAEGGRVRVPTTLNVGSVDLIHPELFTGAPELAEAGARLMRAHEALGCLPSYTCAPYQLLTRPRLGDQVAWAESNAIVFANAVLGARTERYGDFVDLACALTGRAPDYGLHRAENRLATVVVEVEPPAEWRTPLRACVAVGHAIGKRCGARVAAIVGLPADTTEDDLKALGAVAASAGETAMFHAVGLTPEAPTLAAATGGRAVETIRLSADDLRRIVAGLSTLVDGAPITSVTLGTPHASVAELDALLATLEADPRPLAVPLTINTRRDALERLETDGRAARLRASGVTILVDTCVYLTASMTPRDGAMMTNSGKAAYYAPGNIGCEVAFGSLEDCVASARAGRVVRA